MSRPIADPSSAHAHALSQSHTPTSSQNPQSPTTDLNLGIWWPASRESPSPPTPRSLSPSPPSPPITPATSLPLSRFDQLSIYSQSSPNPPNTNQWSTPPVASPPTAVPSSSPNRRTTPAPSQTASTPTYRTPPLTFQIHTSNAAELHPELLAFQNTPELVDEPATEIFILEDQHVCLSPPAPRTNAVRLQPPATKNMSFLECVVETLKGTDVLKRNHFLSATDTIIWLTSDMCHIKYKLKRKASPPVIRTISLANLDGIVHSDRLIQFLQSVDKKPLSFIFPTQMKADLWLCGLCCLISESTRVTSSNRQIQLRHGYNAYCDSWNGKPLPTRKRLSEYILLGTIGKGSFGKVKLALCTRDTMFYAIKVIPKRQLQPHTTILSFSRANQITNMSPADVKEVKILSGLEHPNIMHLEGAFNDEPEEKFHLVFEYVPGGPIMDTSNKHIASSTSTSMAEPLPEGRVREVCLDVIAGLQYLHAKNIVHRDIKPDNLLVAGDESIKICDFGSALQYSSRDPRHPMDANIHRRLQGTPAFTAPELCGTPASPEMPQRCYAADIWSLGITLYVLLYGCTPFRAAKVEEIYTMICKQRLAFPSFPEVSQSCQTTLRHMLEKEPAKRATIADVALSPWLDEDPTVEDRVKRIRDTLPRRTSGTTVTEGSQRRMWPRR